MPSQGRHSAQVSTRFQWFCSFDVAELVPGLHRPGLWARVVPSAATEALPDSLEALEQSVS